MAFRETALFTSSLAACSIRAVASAGSGGPISTEKNLVQRRWRAGPLGSVRRRAMFVCVGLLFYRNVLTAQEQEDQDDSSDGDSVSADDEGWPGAGLLYLLVLVGGGAVTAKEKIAGWRDRRRD